MNFCNWIELNEIKTPKKSKTSVVTHTDIDRWLKSVDGFAKDLQDLKRAKEKSQSKLDQIKKKYVPEKEKDQKPVEKDQGKSLDQNSDNREADREDVPAVEPTEALKLKPKELSDGKVVIRKPIPRRKQVKPTEQSKEQN